MFSSILKSRKVASLFTQPSFGYYADYQQLNARALREIEYDYKSDHEKMRQRLRQFQLEKTILAKDKIIIPSKYRTPDDTLAKLRSSNHCAAIVKEKDEFPELDLVLQNRSIYSIRTRNDAKVRSYHIQTEDNQQIRCTLENIYYHWEKHWIIQAVFNRYIPGRPNLLYVPFVPKLTRENPYIVRGAEWQFKTFGVWLLCYNEDYPTSIEVDLDECTPSNNLRVIDIAQTFPDGVYLDKRYKHQGMMGARIVQFSPTITSSKDDHKTYEMMKKIKNAKSMDEIDEMTNLDAERAAKEKSRDLESLRKKKEVVKVRVGYERNLKKKMSKVEVKVKEGVVPTGAQKK